MTVLWYQITDSKRIITVWATETQKGKYPIKTIFISEDTANNEFTLKSILGNKVIMKSAFPITGVKVGTIFTQK